jgi:hypothetical protein
LKSFLTGQHLKLNFRKTNDPRKNQELYFIWCQATGECIT